MSYSFADLIALKEYCEYKAAALREQKSVQLMALSSELYGSPNTDGIAELKEEIKRYDDYVIEIEKLLETSLKARFLK